MSPPAIREKLANAFSPQQAELLADVISENQDLLVSRTDFTELKQIVRDLAEAQKRTEIKVEELAEAQKRTEIKVEALAEAQKRTEIKVEELAEAQKRTEIKVEELAEAQKRTEIKVEELAEAQKRTEIKVEELAEAQKRTEIKVEELAEAQKRTEIKVEELAEAQKRTEIKVEELAEAQKRTELKVDKLAEAQLHLAQAQQKTETELNKLSLEVRNLARQVGALSEAFGGSLEDFALDLVPEILEKNWGLVITEVGRADFTVGRKKYELDLYIRGKIKNRPIAVLGEVKSNLTASEVQRFLNQAKLLAKAVRELKSVNCRALFFGYRANSEARKLIKDSNAYMVFTHGRIL